MKFSITKMLPFAALLLATMADNSTAQGLRGIFLNTQPNSDNSGICETVKDKFRLGTFDRENIEMISNMNEKFQLYCSDKTLTAKEICAGASTLIESGERYWGSLQQIKAVSYSVSTFCETGFFAEHKGLFDFVSMAGKVTTQDDALGGLALFASELFPIDTTAGVGGMFQGLVGGLVEGGEDNVDLQPEP